MNLFSTPYISTKPGEVEHARCPVCGQEAFIERDVLGPTGFAEAIAGGQHLHDRVICPSEGALWHGQARLLKEESRSTASPRLRELILSEVEALVERYVAT